MTVTGTNNTSGSPETQNFEICFNPETGMDEKKHSLIIDEETGTAVSTPQIISFEITSMCNLRCIMCGFHSVYKKNRKGGRHMDMEIFERCLPFIERAELVPLCGGGEPLMNPDLPAMIERISECGVSSAITTNGILLNEKKIREIMEAGLTYIEISIDGIESYERIRGVPFERLGKNLRRLAEAKIRRKSLTPIIDLSYTAMRDTLSELPGIIELGAESGAREIRVQPLQVCFEPLIDQNIYLDEERSKEILGKARDIAEELGVKLLIRRLALFDDERYGDDGRANYYFTRYNCLEPFNSLMVLADGRVQVCCAGIILPRSLPKYSLEDIWNSSEMKKLRLELIQGKFREKCKTCNLIHGSRENQVIMQDKATLSGLLRLERRTLILYREHLRKRGLVRGNIDAIKKLGRELRRKE